MPLHFTPTANPDPNDDRFSDPAFEAFMEECERCNWEQDRFRSPRVRRCPLCEQAVYGNLLKEEDCEIHGDPYESPYEADIMYERLFGTLPPDTTPVARRRIRNWQVNFPMPAPTWGPFAQRREQEEEEPKKQKTSLKKHRVP